MRRYKLCYNMERIITILCTPLNTKPCVLDYNIVSMLLSFFYKSYDLYIVCIISIYIFKQKLLVIKIRQICKYIMKLTKYLSLLRLFSKQFILYNDSLIVSQHSLNNGALSFKTQINNIIMDSSSNINSDKYNRSTVLKIKGRRKTSIT